MIRLYCYLRSQEEKGSLSLENILFITAIAAVGSAVITFYGGLGDWFGQVSLPNAPNIGGTTN